MVKLCFLRITEAEIKSQFGLWSMIWLVMGRVALGNCWKAGGKAQERYLRLIMYRKWLSFGGYNLQAGEMPYQVRPYWANMLLGSRSRTWPCGPLAGEASQHWTYHKTESGEVAVGSPGCHHPLQSPHPFRVLTMSNLLASSRSSSFRTISKKSKCLDRMGG